MQSEYHEQDLVWCRGAIIPRDKAVVSLLSPTAQFGLNTFEGVRGYWNESENQLLLFRLDDHLERLFSSCKILGIISPYSAEEIHESIRLLLQMRSCRQDVAVRVILFVDGFGGWSSSDPVSLLIAPINKSRRSAGDLSGARACVSTWVRIDDQTLPPRAKVGANYVNSRYGQLEATANGYEFPIFLDRHGNVTEGAGACLMMVRKGTLITPRKTSSILESITRDTLLVLAQDIGLSIEQRDINRTELYLADELFLCGSAVEVAPLSSVDQRVIGEGLMGPWTRKLLDKYHLVVDGRDRVRRHWLTSVWPKG